MILIAKCSHCKNPIKIKGTLIDSRIALSRKKGNEFEKKCPGCRTRNQIHVDDVRAELNTRQFIVVTILSVVLAVFLTTYFLDLGFISTTSFLIPILVVSSLRLSESKRIKSFNMLYIDRKRIKEKTAEKNYS